MLLIVLPSISIIISPNFIPLCQAGDSVLTNTTSIPWMSFKDLILHPKYGSLLYSIYYYYSFPKDSDGSFIIIWSFDIIYKFKPIS